MTYSKKIVEQYGQEYIFRQLAEESAELCQASLKMVRRINNETPVRWADAQDRLLEEIADLEVMLHVTKTAVLKEEANRKIAEIYQRKFDRMVDRMFEGEPLDSNGR